MSIRHRHRFRREQSTWLLGRLKLWPRRSRGPTAWAELHGAYLRAFPEDPPITTTQLRNHSIYIERKAERDAVAAAAHRMGSKAAELQRQRDQLAAALDVSVGELVPERRRLKPSPSPSSTATTTATTTTTSSGRVGRVMVPSKRPPPLEALDADRVEFRIKMEPSWSPPRVLSPIPPDHDGDLTGFRDDGGPSRPLLTTADGSRRRMPQENPHLEENEESSRASGGDVSSRTTTSMIKATPMTATTAAAGNDRSRISTTSAFLKALVRDSNTASSTMATARRTPSRTSFIHTLSALRANSLTVSSPSTRQRRLPRATLSTYMAALRPALTTTAPANTVSHAVGSHSINISSSSSVQSTTTSSSPSPSAVDTFDVLEPPDHTPNGSRRRKFGVRRRRFASPVPMPPTRSSDPLARPSHQLAASTRSYRFPDLMASTVLPSRLSHGAAPRATSSTSPRLPASEPPTLTPSSTTATTSTTLEEKIRELTTKLQTQGEQLQTQQKQLETATASAKTWETQYREANRKATRLRSEVKMAEKRVAKLEKRLEQLERAHSQCVSNRAAGDTSPSTTTVGGNHVNPSVTMNPTTVVTGPNGGMSLTFSFRMDVTPTSGEVTTAGSSAPVS